MRLNLYIAKCGYASRRKADLLIKQGKVRVNQNKVCQPFFRVRDKDLVEIGDKLLKFQSQVYFLFNKPKGVTTTVKDRFATSKIVDFFPKSLGRIYPVGRLDKESSGLLIMTNDGDLCYKLTHPKFSVEKEYLVILPGNFTLTGCKKARKGVNSKGDFLKVKNIRIVEKKENKTFCRVIITEGKKRHLRRLFKKLGFEAEELKRIRIGGIKLYKLDSGKYKPIDKNALLKTFSSNS
jgi:23S rRNA pseudouridine2605 synthase